MNCHLHSGGKDLGIFPLEELRRRRNAGELSGTEYVWCEGMPNWLPLDLILQQTAPAAYAPAPPPLPAGAARASSNRKLLWWFAGAVGIFILIVILAGVTGTKLSGRLFPLLNRQTAFERTDASELAKKPITWTTNTLTEAAVQKRARKFRERQWLEGYKQHGLRSEPCYAEVQQFLGTWISRNYSNDAQTNLPPDQDWAEKLAAAPGCNDPLALTVIAVNSAKRQDKIKRLEDALNGFQNSQHTGYPKFYAAVMLATELGSQSSRVAALDASALQFLKQALTDGSLNAQDQAELAEIFINTWGHNFFNRNHAEVCRIADDSAKTFPWLALVLRGELNIIEAWKSRGNGYSDSVSEAGWRGFNNHLASARQCLTKAWKLEPGLPLAPARMIYVSLGDSGLEEMRNWFDRTVTAQIDYARAWSDMRWGLRPRWYGDENSLLAFGVMAANTKRFDTDVPRKLFDVVSDIESEESVMPGRHLYARDDIWPHLRDIYEGYIAAASQKASRDGWRSSYFAVAFLARKYDVARQQLEALDWKPLPFSLTGWGVDLSLAPLEVAARTGPAGTQITEAEDAFARADFTKAAALYKSASLSVSDQRTTQFIRLRLDEIDKQTRLRSGKWTDFLPIANDDGSWETLRGGFQLLPGGELQIRGAPNGHMLFNRARIGPDFEIRGEFDVPQFSNQSFQAGLVMGIPSFNTRNWYAFRMIQNPGSSAFGRLSTGWARPEMDQPVTLKNEHNTFDLTFQNGKFTILVNGQKIFSETAPPQIVPVRMEDFRAGFGAFDNTGQTVLVYRNVQIRVLRDGQTSGETAH